MSPGVLAEGEARPHGGVEASPGPPGSAGPGRPTPLPLPLTGLECQRARNRPGASVLRLDSLPVGLMSLLSLLCLSLCVFCFVSFFSSIISFFSLFRLCWCRTSGCSSQPKLFHESVLWQRDMTSVIFIYFGGMAAFLSLCTIHAGVAAVLEKVGHPHPSKENKQKKH